MNKPSNWLSGEFGDYVTIKSQKFDPKKQEVEKKCIELEHIEQETGRVLGNTTTLLSKSTKNIFAEGDILFGKLRPYLKKFAKAPFSGVCSSEIWVLTPKEKLNRNFLFYIIQSDSFIEEANKSCGTKMPRADWGVVAKYRIHLPPISEQVKIADIMSLIDEKLDIIEDKIIETRNLKNGLIQKLFFSDYMKPERLGDLLIEKPAYGANASACEYAEGKTRYVRITDINDRGRLLDSKVSLNLPDCNDYLLHDGDIIIARSGNTVGKSYLYNANDGVCAYAGYLIRFRTDVKKLLPRYLSQFLMTERYWNWIKNNIKVGAQPNINAQQYQSLEIPICPISDQENIINILEAIDSKIDLLEQQKSETQLLKKGMMQKLLTGEWRVPLDYDEEEAA